MVQGSATNQWLFPGPGLTPRSFAFFGEAGVEVTLGESDRLEYVLKKFRRQIAKSGLLQDMKRKRFYEAPGAQRRRKEKAAARRKSKTAHRREHPY
jgi:small subunit ribosomal protein S21